MKLIFSFDGLSGIFIQEITKWFIRENKNIQGRYKGEVFLKRHIKDMYKGKLIHYPNKDFKFIFPYYISLYIISLKR